MHSGHCAQQQIRNQTYRSFRNVDLVQTELWDLEWCGQPIRLCYRLHSYWSCLVKAAGLLLRYYFSIIVGQSRHKYACKPVSTVRCLRNLDLTYYGGTVNPVSRPCATAMVWIRLAVGSGGWIYCLYVVRIHERILGIGICELTSNFRSNFAWGISVMFPTKDLNIRTQLAFY
jgi:hypothetical protein